MMQSFKLFDQPLNKILNTKALINTLNAYSYNLTHTDALYLEALLNSDVLIPDGISIVYATNWLTGKKIKKIAGADLFYYEMERLNQSNGSCFFLGSNERTLTKIRQRSLREYPNIRLRTYSPPYKQEFDPEDDFAMIDVINSFHPDVLFIGMTAPKQEKWAWSHRNQINAETICCIGAVFDFYAGTIKRAPKWMIEIGLEWFYRLMKEPRRMWRRYLLGNFKFIISIIREKYAIGNIKFK